MKRLTATGHGTAVREFIESIAPEEPRGLQEIAANEAINVLLGNWADALLDGWALDQLLNDVDEVIELLQDWKAWVKRRTRLDREGGQ